MAQQYQILHIMGGTEPELEGPPAKSWEELENDVVRLFASKHFMSDDGLFLITLDGRGRIEAITAFDSDFVDEMWRRAEG